MPAPLVPILFPSIYKSAGLTAPLPKRMATCTPDTKAALIALRADLAKEGGDLRLSDLFRSRDMQLQAHLDYASGKKAAFSPPPGGSMHEAGRAFDMDLGGLGTASLARFWEIAKPRGVVPIIAEPRTSAKEAWHFECRGSFALVLAHYAAGKGTNMKPARAMAAAAIAALGIELDDFPGRNREVRLQSGLIRLGADPGNIDGAPGNRTKLALQSLGIEPGGVDQVLDAVEARLAERFPAEWYDKTLVSEEIGAIA
jgi:hypothetical protein